MIKFGFKVKTRNGVVLDNLQVAARDREDAERKIRQIYHNCEIMESAELRPTIREDALDLEAMIALINREGAPGRDK
jgi:hypothetical protein